MSANMMVIVSVVMCWLACILPAIGPGPPGGSILQPGRRAPLAPRVQGMADPPSAKGGTTAGPTGVQPLSPHGIRGCVDRADPSDGYVSSLQMDRRYV